MDSYKLLKINSYLCQYVTIFGEIEKISFNINLYQNLLLICQAIPNPAFAARKYRLNPKLVCCLAFGGYFERE